MKVIIFFALIGAAFAGPISHLTSQETVVESRNDGFDQAVEVTSQEVAPASQQLIVEEQEQVTETPVPVMPKVDLSQYMMLIPADQIRNFVHIPIPVPTVSSSVSVNEPILSTSVSVGPVQTSSYGSSYGGSSYGSSSVVRNLSGVKGGSTIVRTESIKGLPPPPVAARKTSSTIILP